MKTLVLVTSQFPFGNGETFIGSEFPFLNQSFDKIIIISQNVSHLKTRNVTERTIIKRYNPSTSIFGFFLIPVLIFMNLMKIISMYREECSFRRLQVMIFKNRLNLLKKIIKAIQLRDFIKKTLKSEKINKSIVFYSYWLKSGAHAIGMLKYKDSIKISRAHGSDIYEEKTESGYLPLLRYSAQNLNAIFFISENGKKYFEEKVGFTNPLFLVSYLGTEKSSPITRSVTNSQKYIVVSCSNLIPLKRIDLLIRALGAVRTDKEVEWIHFGDGSQRNELENLAKSVLHDSKKIKYRFMGQFKNDELLHYYEINQIDLFINTSTTEGLPVSIMEAQSYGIPVIATDTGGVKEIVKDGTGSLLPVDFKPEDLARLIEYYFCLSESEKNIIRNNAKHNWNMNFRAESNYNDFINKVNSILASAK